MKDPNTTPKPEASGASTGSAFAVGQEVTWIHVPRGGWGFPVPVPARVVKLNTKTIRIEARRKGGEWVTRSVKPESLRHLKQNDKDDSPPIGG